MRPEGGAVVPDTTPTSRKPWDFWQRVLRRDNQGGLVSGGAAVKICKNHLHVRDAG